MAAQDSPFLARWSRRKAQARAGDVLVEPAAVGAALLPQAAPVTATPVTATSITAAPAADLAVAAAPEPATELAPAPDAEAPPPLTLADVAQLTRESDYSAFVARGVTPEVKHAALKKLFTDPHFNIMDGLDTYIDDYGKPDPLPPGMLRQMVQSKMLGLFDDEDEAAQKDAKELAQDKAPDDIESAIQPAIPPDIPPATAPETPALPPDTAAHEDPDLQLQPDDDAGCAGPAPGVGQNAGRQH